MATSLSPRLETMAGNLHRLAGIMLDEQYDDEFIRPTREAFEKAWSMLVEAERAFPREAPGACPAPVGDGGILIEWRHGERTVFLAIPAEPSHGYLYLRGPEYRRTIRELTGEAVASSVRWLLEDE